MVATVDVVIVRFGDTSLLRRAVVAAQSIRGVARVVVVDHGGPPLTLDAGVEVIVSENRGFGAGVNRGVAATASSYVLLLNPDAVVRPAGVERGAALLDAEPTVAAVQGAIRGIESGEPERSSGVLLGARHLWGRALGLRALLRSSALSRVARLLPGTSDHVVRVPPGDTDVDWLAATAVLIRRAAFVEVGGFDERYFLYGEDLDLCRRLRDAGWRLVAIPDEWAEHGGGLSSASWVEREIAWWRGTGRYLSQWSSLPTRVAARLAAVVRFVTLATRHRGAPRHAWQEIVRLR